MPTTLNGTTGIVTPAVAISGALSAVTETFTNPPVNAANPCFSAWNNVAQSISGSFSKVLFQVEEYDTTNAYDNVTNHRFMPLVAGYYQINASVQVLSAATVGVIGVYKNGTAYKYGNQVNTQTNPQLNAAINVYLNGSTDYIEVYAYSSVTGNTQNLSGQTYFQAALISRTT